MCLTPTVVVRWVIDWVCLRIRNSTLSHDLSEGNPFGSSKLVSTFFYIKLYEDLFSETESHSRRSLSVLSFIVNVPCVIGHIHRVSCTPTGCDKRTVFDFEHAE